MNVKLTKSEVARIAQILTITKLENPNVLTPMSKAVNNATNFGKACNTETIKEQYIRVARYLGWSVAKRSGRVYENGCVVWSTGGN